MICLDYSRCLLIRLAFGMESLSRAYVHVRMIICGIMCSIPTDGSTTNTSGEKMKVDRYYLHRDPNLYNYKKTNNNITRKKEVRVTMKELTLSKLM